MRSRLISTFLILFLNLPIQGDECLRASLAVSTTANPQDSLSQLINFQYEKLSFAKNQLEDPEHLIHLIKSPGVKELYELAGEDFLYHVKTSVKDTSLKTIELPNTQATTRGNITLEDFKENPQDFVVLYHGTDMDSSKIILDSGPDLERGNGEFGKGLYFTTNYDQAKEWSLKGNRTSSSVLQLIIPKAKFKEIIDQGNSITFPRNLNPTSHPERSVLFTNFTNANRVLREKPLPPERIDPLYDVDIIAGPTVSAKKNVSDQIKFGNTDITRELFFSDEQMYLIRAVE